MPTNTSPTPATSSTPVALFIVHQARPGQRDAVRDVWLAHMAPAIAANPAHLQYVYSYDAAEPGRICAFQLYSSAAEAAAFLATPAYAAYLAAAEPLLAGPPQIVDLVPQWRKPT